MYDIYKIQQIQLFRACDVFSQALERCGERGVERLEVVVQPGLDGVLLPVRHLAAVLAHELVGVPPQGALLVRGPHRGLAVLAWRNFLDLPLEQPVGVLWIASFFVVRVLPVPWLLYVYARTMLLQSATCGLSATELVVGAVTLPIPIGLNLFWFWLMMKKVQRMLSRASKKTPMTTTTTTTSKKKQ